MDIVPVDRKLSLVSVYGDYDIEYLKNKRYYIKLNNLSRHKRYDNFHIMYKDCHKCGIYKIQLANVIYVGQTADFQQRFKGHMNNNSMMNFIKGGATTSIIQFEDNHHARIALEKEYILKYSRDEYYICINVEFRGA